LIGEEFFAASAYLSDDPLQIGSLKGQDYGKFLSVLVLVIGIFLATLISFTSWMHWAGINTEVATVVNAYEVEPLEIIESKLLSSFVAEHGSSYGVTIDSKLIDLPNSGRILISVEKISQKLDLPKENITIGNVASYIYQESQTPNNKFLANRDLENQLELAMYPAPTEEEVSAFVLDAVNASLDNGGASVDSTFASFDTDPEKEKFLHRFASSYDRKHGVSISTKKVKTVGEFSKLVFANTNGVQWRFRDDPAAAEAVDWVLSHKDRFQSETALEQFTYVLSAANYQGVGSEFLTYIRDNMLGEEGFLTSTGGGNTDIEGDDS
jgi:hypothetical protein